MAWIPFVIQAASEVVSPNESTTTTQNYSTEMQAILDKLTGQLAGNIDLSAVLGTSKQFSKEQAIADSAVAKTKIMNTLKQETLPQLSITSNSTGGFGSSGASLLASKALNEAAAASSQAESDMISKYADLSTNLQQSELNKLLGLLQLEKGSKPNIDVSTESMWESWF